MRSGCHGMDASFVLKPMRSRASSDGEVRSRERPVARACSATHILQTLGQVTEGSDPSSPQPLVPVPSTVCLWREVAEGIDAVIDCGEGWGVPIDRSVESGRSIGREPRRSLRRLLAIGTLCDQWQGDLLAQAGPS